jgi:CheY-like chemotaxis protein
MVETVKSGGHYDEHRPALPQTMPNASEAIDPDRLRQHILGGKSEFGRYIRGLVRQLSAITGIEDTPRTRRRESMQTFHTIHDFMREGDNLSRLTDLKLTREDILFLLCDPIGALVRRPVLNFQFTALLDRGIGDVTGGLVEAKDALLKPLRASAWSGFIHVDGFSEEVLAKFPGEAIWIDTVKEMDRFNAAVKLIPDEAEKMVEKCFQVVRSFREPNIALVAEDYRRVRAANPEKWDEGPFLTDPWHAFDQGHNISFRKADVTAAQHPTNERKSGLLMKRSFMGVDDNPGHLSWVKTLKGRPNLVFYTPDEEDMPKDEATANLERMGCYLSAARAEEVIRKRLDAGGKPPSIIIADIEMPGKDGIKFITDMYTSEERAGRRPMILMLYSSNPDPYQKRIDELVKRGIILGQWDKRTFDPEELITAINAEILERSVEPLIRRVVPGKAIYAMPDEIFDAVHEKGATAYFCPYYEADKRWDMQVEKMEDLREKIPAFKRMAPIQWLIFKEKAATPGNIVIRESQFKPGGGYLESAEHELLHRELESEHNREVFLAAFREIAGNGRLNDVYKSRFIQPISGWEPHEFWVEWANPTKRGGGDWFEFQALVEEEARRNNKEFPNFTEAKRRMSKIQKAVDGEISTMAEILTDYVFRLMHK